MFGFFIAVLAFFYHWFAAHASAAVALTTVATVLFWWYVGTSVIRVGLVALQALGITTLSTFAGSVIGNALLRVSGAGAGALVGAAAGGAIATLTVIFTLMSCALFTGGAWLLSTAGAAGTITMWKAVVGIILIFFGAGTKSGTSDDD